ncbi:MAG: hypothetical protein IJN40_01445, partial [Clostridia bacterium]|nr:hypothetical protein [Clostridia bacterium]
MAGSIKKDILEGCKSKVYLVWGEEDFLKDYYAKAMVSSTLNKDFADFNYKEYTSGNVDTDAVESFFA